MLSVSLNQKTFPSFPSFLPSSLPTSVSPSLRLSLPPFLPFFFASFFLSSLLLSLHLFFLVFSILILQIACFILFRHLGSQLSELEKLIEKMLQADYSKYVTSELNRPFTDLEVLMHEVWNSLYYPHIFSNAYWIRCFVVSMKVNFK